MDEVLSDDVKLVEAAINTLSEHFDTVQILVTKHEGADGTTYISRGRGNYLARYGQAKLWVLQEEKAV